MPPQRPFPATKAASAVTVCNRFVMAETGRATGTWILIAAIVGSAMIQVDGTAVNVALPALQRDFKAGGGEVQWVIEGYSLFLSALILTGGSLGDHLGRKRIFALGIAIFSFASLGCAFAPTMTVLIVSRCIQGVGGALATPGSLALVSANFQGDARGKAFGTWSAAGAATSALGPVLGGYLTQVSTWRWVFLLNVPLAISVLVILFWCVPESRDPRAEPRIDLIGAVLATLGLGGFVYGCIALQSAAGRPQIAQTCIAAGVLFLAAFVYAQTQVKTPMMPLNVFRSRTFSATNVYTFALYGALGGSLYFLPFDLQNIHGYSPAVAGTALLPFVLSMVVLSRFTGGLYHSVGARLPLVVGAAIAGLGYVGFAMVGSGGSYWTTFFLPALLLGVGAAFFVAPLTTAVFDSAPPDMSGLASGINNAVARTAGLVAIAVLGLVMSTGFNAAFEHEVTAHGFSAQTRAVALAQRDRIVNGDVPDTVRGAERASLASAVRHSYVAGFRIVMLATAGLTLVAALVALLYVAPRPRTP